ncbi:M48 family metallopeptidase [Ureibacillus manganicus]|uniref:Uncharacterized protein n=1 Tax=Ureibacillus manganicus DSM 26584 TaxID=1384049 RepID=A0A0A3HLU1_9BACL|nr:M48 family metallopeptidase [Ureibacillus manganicus]KGR73546.1 hypothetical protein CD29_19710 [Ureibacillus manganicus DSM 26584]
MISKDLFEHPEIDTALKEFLDLCFFEKEIMHYYEEFEKKKQIPDLLGKTVKVTEHQIPFVFELAQKIAKQIGMEVPSIYVYEDFYYGIESKGLSPSWIEISAKTVTDLSEDELYFLLAREMCSIKMNYIYYHILIDESVKAVHYQAFDVSILQDSWKIIMHRWSRLANYSADCFAYAVCGNIGSAIKAINKLVLNNTFLAEQLYIPDFIKQSEQISLLDDEVSLISKQDERVPYAPLRIKNLISYAASKRGIEAVKYFLMERV